MESIAIDDIVLVGLVTILATLQISTFAQRVGKARGEFKVEVPAVTGPDGFNRVFRAHQNSLEFFPVILALMWMTALFLHQVPAAVCGLGYCWGRQTYFNGYSKSAKDRLPGFYMLVRFLKMLVGLSILGITHTLLLTYLHINMKTWLWFTIGLKTEL